MDAGIAGGSNENALVELKPQMYQIVINVIEARKLLWSTAQAHNSFVVVGIGKKKHKTNVQRNSVDPFYKEFFIFEVFATVADIQRINLWIAVLEPRCYSPPRIIGEAKFGLGYVWSQPNHQLTRKWIQLSESRSSGTTNLAGYLKLDICITRKSDMDSSHQIMPTTVTHDAGDTNVYNVMVSEQQMANYIITIYGAYGLPCGGANKEKKITKLPSTCVRVCFCGLMVNTSTLHRTNNPEFKERIYIVEMFPNVNDEIRFEVCSVEGFNRVLASATLKLAEISYDGENGFLPTFGPSLIHMYCTSNYNNSTVNGEDSFYYRGALLVSLSIEVPYFSSELRSLKLEPVPEFSLDGNWYWEDFVATCLLTEVSMVDRSIFEKSCGIAITIGEMNISKKTNEENKKLYYTGNVALVNEHSAYGYLEFFNSFPVIQLTTQLPDFRFRMYRNNMITAMVQFLDNTVSNVEKRLRTYDYNSLSNLLSILNNSLDDVAVRIVKFVDLIQYCVENTEEKKQNLSTELDQKQIALQLDTLGKIYGSIIAKECRQNLHGKRKKLKSRLTEIKILIEKLNTLVTKSTEGWPDIVMWMLCNGSRAAYCKIPASDIIYSALQDQSGQFCGKLKSFYMKPLRCLRHMNSTISSCNCLVGKIEMLTWMGQHKQMPTFSEFIPPGFIFNNKDEIFVSAQQMTVECRVFVFQVTLSEIKESDQAQIFVRIHINNTVKDTEPKPKSRSIIWDEVVKFRKIMYTSMERLEKIPPTALCEVYEKYDSDKDAENLNLIGRFTANTVLNVSEDKSPKLESFDIYRGQECTGGVRMSLELVQSQEKVVKIEEYGENDRESNVVQVSCMREIRDRIPAPMAPRFHTYKVDVYWWGLRDVINTKKPCAVLEIDDLSIQSKILSEKKPCCNFESTAVSRVFEVASNENYFPPIVIKLFDSTTFGRTVFSGKKIVQNPKKYFVNWYLKDERDASLQSASILSCTVTEVSQKSFIFDDPKKVKSYSSTNMNTKSQQWRGLFRKRKIDDEKITLLPAAPKETFVMKRVHQRSTDWWFRYYSALNTCVEERDQDDEKTSYNKIMIYEAELEQQPGFNKFKDWCSTLKLYNGDKTGIPEKDDQIKRGYVKAGIAIYKWPPPEDTVAVSASGVDLNNGYFSDHPSNESKKFLIRTYIINGINLAREYDGKSNPYIVIRCGNKEFGDRDSFVPMASNPIFGRMYEFRCTLPDDYLLKISLYDHNILPPDDLIGSTTIDLEDRIYTKHRAMVGLPSEYDVNFWRDFNKPSVILEELCTKNHIAPPISSKSSTVVMNGVEYSDDGRERRSYISHLEQKERICLSILNKWHTVPICGYQLVPEHIETRTLIHSEKPGLAQGKIQMWLDIFPLDTFVHIPPPVDITPKSLGEYELRLIVWDVKNIKLINKNDKKKRKIFVKAWLGIPEHFQSSDVQKFKSDEVITFNWRMIFDLQYHHSEKKIIIEDRRPFIEIEEHAQPNLVVQVLNFDPDDTCEILGTCSLNLNSMCRGSKNLDECQMEILRSYPKLNIFTAASVRAWWPLNKTNQNTCETIQTGAINMEICILPKEKAVLTPVGYGRSSPWPLPPPTKFNRVFNVFFLSDERVKINEILNKKSSKVIITTIFGLLLLLFVLTYVFGYTIFNKKKWPRCFLTNQASAKGYYEK